MSNPNDPAYATSGLSGLPNGEFIYGQLGMTIRQRFVMAAMQGLCANPTLVNQDVGDAASLAKEARIFADAALAEEATTRRET